MDHLLTEAREEEKAEYEFAIVPFPFFQQGEPLSEPERRELLLAASARHDAIQLASAARVPKPLTGLEKGARAKWHKELNLDPPQPKPHPWLDPDLPLSDAERRQFANDVEELNLSYFGGDRLPSGVWKLRNLRKLTCYRSAITHVSPQIGNLRKLNEFVPYTSYNLHWLPYEVHDTSLPKAHISRRAMYGYSNSLPLPRLAPFPTGAKSLQEMAARVVVSNSLDESKLTAVVVDYINSANRCSYCHEPYWETSYQCWSIWSCDRVPLLALVCSRQCVARLANRVVPEAAT